MLNAGNFVPSASQRKEINS